MFFHMGREQMLTLTKKEYPEKISDHIVVFDNILAGDFCDELIAEFNMKDEWNFAQTGLDASVNKSIRNVDTISLSTAEVIQVNLKIREKIEKTLFHACGEVIRQYQRLFPFCRVIEGLGFELLRYEVGGFYKLHTDSFKRVPRELAFSFSLNDDYEGGEWAFFCGEKIMKPAKGSVIVFPANFMFPHEIMPVTRGTRYSVVTWMI